MHEVLWLVNPPADDGDPRPPPSPNARQPQAAGRSAEAQARCVPQPLIFRLSSLFCRLADMGFSSAEIAAQLGLGAAQAQLAGVAPNTAAAIARSHKASTPKSKKRQAEPAEPQEGTRKSARGGPSYNEEQIEAQKAVSTLPV